LLTTLKCLQRPRAVLDEVTHALSELGIEVEQVHAESAGGQFEIATAHELALTVRADYTLDSRPSQ